MQSNANVLQVENIITRFNTQDGKVFAVNGISFDLKEGELLGVVGESGSGKSVTMMSLLKLLPMPPAEIVEGRALFENQDLIQMDLNQLRKIRGGKIGFIFQDPMKSLNPVLTVGYQLMEPMREHLASHPAQHPQSDHGFRNPGGGQCHHHRICLVIPGAWFPSGFSNLGTLAL